MAVSRFEGQDGIVMASLRRRLRASGAWLYRTEVACRYLGITSPKIRQLLARTGETAYDLAEVLRTGGRANGVARLSEAALTAPGLLPQQPHHLHYWYDPSRHSLVGLFLGLDVYRHDGKYHVLETNVRPALKGNRRDLYDTDLDPFITELLTAAKTGGFERLIFYRHGWHDFYWPEFERASRASGIEVIGASTRPWERGYMPALPEPLAERTLYVDFADRGGTPLSHFLNNKLWSARWLHELLRTEGSPNTQLACVPTFDRLTLPDDPPDPRWPNLVVKLANADKGQYIAMGRFDSEAQARRWLRLPNDPSAIPGIFQLSRTQRLARRLFPIKDVVYQPFIPPEVISNRIQKIRLLVFISPLFNLFLSTQYVSAGEDLPDRPLPIGLLQNPRPYACSFALAGGRFQLVSPQAEDELREVGLEFGRLANLAITRKFETGP
jgi:hypothetical protein